MGDSPIAGDTHRSSSNEIRPPTFGSLDWDHGRQSDDSTCPGDLSTAQVESNLHHFNAGILSDFNFLGNEDTAMDLDFIPFGVQVQQTVASPSDSLRTSNIFAASVPQIFPPPTSIWDMDTSPSSASIRTEEDWPCFRCISSSGQPINPRTGSDYLSSLEESFNNPSIWTGTEHSGSFTETTYTGDLFINVETIQESLWDRLMVISQAFLSRARGIHLKVNDRQSLRNPRTVSNTNITGFFILPPPSVLDALLRIYACRVELYIPFFPTSNINLSQLIAADDERPSILLILLMIAHGAMGSALPQARALASGLIETCRICLFDIMEKNVQLARHPVMLRCALLYLNATAWSGNKWHMDVSPT